MQILYLLLKNRRPPGVALLAPEGESRLVQGAGGIGVAFVAQNVAERGGSDMDGGAVPDPLNMVAVRAGQSRGNDGPPSAV